MGLSSYLHPKSTQDVGRKAAQPSLFGGPGTSSRACNPTFNPGNVYDSRRVQNTQRQSSRALSPCCCSTRGWIYDGRDILYPPLWCGMGTWTSKVPKTMAAIPQIEGIWTILLGISEVQVHLTSPACSYDLMPGLASPWNCCSRDSQYRRPRTPLLDFGRYLTSRCKVLG